MNFAIGFQCLELTFKPITMNDGAFLYDAVSSDAFPSDLALAELNDLEEARKWCEKRVSQWADKQCYVWTCYRTCNNQAIGQVTLSVQGRVLVLAYWVHPKQWGQGLATDMCASLISHLVQSGYQGDIQAKVHAWNTRSESVLLKLGFEKVIKMSQTKSENQFQLKTMKP